MKTKSRLTAVFVLLAVCFVFSGSAHAEAWLKYNFRDQRNAEEDMIQRGRIEDKHLLPNPIRVVQVPKGFDRTDVKADKKHNLVSIKDDSSYAQTVSYVKAESRELDRFYLDPFRYFKE